MSPDTARVPVSSAADTVAIVGNPNTGKSTLFNRLTGARQHVGNYPGVTVERVEGTCRLGDRAVTVIDLPGAYSLAAASRDEQVVIDVLAGRLEGQPPPRAVICVVDAANLRRNLFLVSQVAETGIPLVLALNMIDEAGERGLQIDVARLSGRLGVPVVATIATQGRGLDELRSALERALGGEGRFAPVPWPDAVRRAAAELAEAVRAASGRKVTEAEVSRLLFDAEPPETPDGASAAREKARAALREAGLDPTSAEPLLRYRHVDALLEGVASAPDPSRSARAYAVDRFLTHRFWGLVVFAALMFGVFSSIYWAAQPVMDGIEWVFGRIEDWAGAALAGTPMLKSLVVKGVIRGAGGVIVFLPQILVLFFFIAVLEDTGYMARAAFLMDRVFSWTGLNGKSFVPMLSSFACAVPAILATRSIADPRARISTILVAPLMSCSARLPVYVLMIGAFIQPVYGAVWSGAALFAMHLLGLVVAIPVAFCINRWLLKLRTIPFLLEMPPYRRPLGRVVLRRMYFSGKEFVVRAGTVILAFSIVIWALTYFPRPDSVREAVFQSPPAGMDVGSAVESAYLEQSLMGRFGKAVQPAFAPAGFDWRITVGLLAAFPAREVIISTLGIVYALGDEVDEESVALRDRLKDARWPDGRRVYTAAVAAAIMVFFAFCLQCGSTVAVMAREAGWKWAGFGFAYMTALAWAGAVATYQIGTAIGGGA
jgi:ferrous iron transport protein B